MIDIIQAIFIAGGASVVTGVLASVGTVKGLSIHITYLREGLARVDRTASRAHYRLDKIERRQYPRPCPLIDDDETPLKEL